MIQKAISELKFAIKIIFNMVTLPQLHDAKKRKSNSNSAYNLITARSWYQLKPTKLNI